MYSEEGGNDGKDWKREGIRIEDSLRKVEGRKYTEWGEKYQGLEDCKKYKLKEE